MLLRSLFIASVIGFGIVTVMWLVSLISGDGLTWASGILALAFGLMWFWVHRSMHDPELNPHHSSLRDQGLHTRS